MNIRTFPATARGHITWDWLDTYHSFSFGHFYNPELMGFGALRVVNDDTIAPGQGFGQHPHNDMEIITIPLSGAVEHEDNTGAHGITPTGSVQVMSAGRHVAHSERNSSATEPLTLFQIWIEPKSYGIDPRYAEKAFSPQERDGHWQLLVSNDGRDGSLTIHQDAF
ncbi:MAG: pirin family protein, partial [Candidatus Moraniibacteriota bacterium]